MHIPLQLDDLDIATRLEFEQALLGVLRFTTAKSRIVVPLSPSPLPIRRRSHHLPKICKLVASTRTRPCLPLSNIDDIFIVLEQNVR